MDVVYLENSSLERPILPKRVLSQSEQTKVRELLGRYNLDSSSFSRNRVGFLVGGDITVVLVPKFMWDIGDAHLTAVNAINSHSELLRFFSLVSSFRDRIEKLGTQIKNDKSEPTISVFDLFLDETLAELSKFLSENAQVSFEKLNADTYSIKGRIDFQRQIQLRGAALVPMRCEFPVTNDAHVLYQYSHYFAQVITKYYNNIRRGSSLLHQSIGKHLTHIFECVQHATPEADEALLWERVETFLENPQFHAWTETMRGLKKFLSMITVSTDDKIYFSYLIPMDDWFDKLVKELLLYCESIVPVDGKKLKSQTDNSNSLLGGAHWVNGEHRSESETDLSKKTRHDSHFRTIPDVSFQVMGSQGQTREIVADYKYKTLEINSSGYGLIGFDRADRYQLIAFFLSSIFSESNVSRVLPPKLVVFFNADMSLHSHRAEIPFTLEFDRAFGSLEAVSLKPSQLPKSEKLRIYLVPIDLAQLLTNEKAKKNCIRLLDSQIRQIAA